VKITDGLHGFLWQSSMENNCNSYLVQGEKTVLVDPGHRHLFSHVEQGLRRLGLTVEAVDLVVVTHAHPDHLEGVSKFPKNTLFAMSEEDCRFLQSMASGRYALREPDFFLREGDFAVGDLSFRVFLTPGHSPGSISLYLENLKALFTGDVVFSQGIGRTDLPGGAGRVLRDSIETLRRLPIDYLLPGHGNPLQGREAVEKNFQVIEEYWYPYLR